MVQFVYCHWSADLKNKSQSKFTKKRLLLQYYYLCTDFAPRTTTQ